MTRVLDATVSFVPRRLLVPLLLSSGAIESLTEAVAAVTVEVGGRRATGRGVIYLSDLWAWPDESLRHDQRDAALRALCEELARELPKQFQHDSCHPLELGLRIHDLACGASIAPSPPALARAMCASPFDAAVHDGAGLALATSAFDLFREPSAIPSADRYFPEIGACRAVAELLMPPRFELPAWYVVCNDDSLKSTLVPAIRSRQYRCFKLKISGRDNAADVKRTVEVYRTVVASGVEAPRLTIDSNEANPSADSVLDYLERLSAEDTAAYASLEYIEQPTSRDIHGSPFDWGPVAERKPVMLDEGLADLNLLAESRRQGYSGLALKTCKGHSMLLAAAAWAKRNDMLISLQDLTNPGLALLHGALVGSRLPTINGAELNSPQFTPEANVDFLPHFPELFEPRNGVHRLPRCVPNGLGSEILSMSP
jgi:hypothetical protein